MYIVYVKKKKKLVLIKYLFPNKMLVCNSPCKSLQENLAIRTFLWDPFYLGGLNNKIISTSYLLSPFSIKLIIHLLNWFY